MMILRGRGARLLRKESHGRILAKLDLRGKKVILELNCGRHLRRGKKTRAGLRNRCQDRVIGLRDPTICLFCLTV